MWVRWWEQWFGSVWWPLLAKSIEGDAFGGGISQHWLEWLSCGNDSKSGEISLNTIVLLEGVVKDVGAMCCDALVFEAQTCRHSSVKW
jgi:hypothetical protein